MLPALAGLAIAVTPRGRLRLVASEGHVEPAAGARIRRAFERGEAFGLLHLGATELDAELPPSLAWWRDLARLFVSGLCSLGESATPTSLEVPVPRGEIARMIGGIPPLPGAEYVTPAAIDELWSMLGVAARLQLRESDLSLEQWLAAQHPSWSVVGRVVFHLAENRDDEKKPFAFLATWTQRLAPRRGPPAPGSPSLAAEPGRNAARHIALKAALKEYAGEKNRAALVRLLAPVVRAAEKSELVRELLERGDIYHPLAWSVADAHRFIKEVPVLEEAGVTVRVGEWWKRAANGPRIQIKLGDKVRGHLAAEKLVDFSAELSLDGERITAADVRKILERTEGLALVRGRWIEVDREKLTGLLAEFEAMQRLPDEISLADAMRFVAGATTLAEDRAQIGAAPEWSEVIAGEWLAGVLAGMRGPEGLRGIAVPRALVATLRGYQEAGLRWLWFLGSLGLGACLADDMGLGKTIQVLALLLLRRERKEAQGPSLLVVPATLLANWESEAKRFAPSLGIVFAHPGFDPQDSAATRALDADLVVTTYAYLRRADWLRERVWDLVILDEAQAIKNPGAQQTRLVKSLKSRRRIALTGTPIENRLGDLWSIFDFFSRRRM